MINLFSCWGPLQKLTTQGSVRCSHAITSGLFYVLYPEIKYKSDNMLSLCQCHAKNKRRNLHIKSLKRADSTRHPQNVYLWIVNYPCGSRFKCICGLWYMQCKLASVGSKWLPSLCISPCPGVSNVDIHILQTIYFYGSAALRLDITQRDLQM